MATVGVSVRTIDEEILLDLLNTTPVAAEGLVSDALAEPAEALAWLTERGGLGSERELAQVLMARATIQSIVRKVLPAEAIAPLLEGVRQEAHADARGISWVLAGNEPDDLFSARMIVAWGELEKSHQGRLRPCANEECRRFLLDRSNGNKARWCSMASCGNRMKARRHYERTQSLKSTL